MSSMWRNIQIQLFPQRTQKTMLSKSRKLVVTQEGKVTDQNKSKDLNSNYNYNYNDINTNANNT
jgi:hypothetical protein